MSHAEKIALAISYLRENVKPGDRYHDFTVVGFVDNNPNSARCRFLCKCGKECVLRASYVVNGNTKSCGCRKLLHGETKSKEHCSWWSMICRCNDPKDEHYPNYGGRGIRVCQEWADSYIAFISCVCRKPSPKHTLDRIDVNGHYEPGNVRWATPKEQSRNRRNNKVVTFNGVAMCCAEWCELLGFSKNLVSKRLSMGWSVEKALTTPQQKKKPKAERKPTPSA